LLPQQASILNLRLKSYTSIIASGAGKVLFFRCASASISVTEQYDFHQKKTATQRIKK
jgi:hypothetical protein